MGSQRSVATTARLSACKAGSTVVCRVLFPRARCSDRRRICARALVRQSRVNVAMWTWSWYVATSSSSTWRPPAHVPSRSTVDLCADGLASRVCDHVGPSLKPTNFLTNSVAVLVGMQCRCRGDHEHVQLLQDRIKDAEKHAPIFGRELLKCCEVQKGKDRETCVIKSVGCA